MSSIGASQGYGRRALLAKPFAGFALFRSGVALGQGAEIRLLMLGDSITAGYGLARNEGPPARLQVMLRERGRQVRVIDAGVSGDTSAGGRARLDWALADRPQAAIVALGGNDALRGLTPAQMRANLAAILDRLAQRNIPALLAGMMAPPNLGRDYGDEFRAVFTELARERPEIVFYPFLLEGVAGDPRLNQPDRIHPTAEGAQAIARRMLPFVETLLDRVRLPAAG